MVLHLTSKAKSIQKKIRKVEKFVDAQIKDKEQRKLFEEAFKELRSELESATYESATDDQTGFLNKRYLFEIFLQLSHFAKRDKQYISLLIGDVDSMKAINDTYGHNTGTAVLKHFSVVLDNAVREADPIFRYGGDEFVIICLHDQIDSIKYIIERINKDIRTNPYLKKYRVTMSFGLATNSYQEEKSFEEIFDEADKMLYRVKETKKKRLG